jgi:DNA-binding beta-propeller fold protein YncE
MKSRSPRYLWLALLAALALTLAVAPAATASRALLSEAFLHSGPPPAPGPPPEGEIEGACGLALAPGGSLYVSDYYHRTVDLFSSSADYQSQIVLPGSNPLQGTNTLDAVCGLALDSGGRLYANELHQGVIRLKPTEATIDSGDSTGLALDAAGNLYVNDRTYVAEYEAPVEAGEAPAAAIGLGNLGDAYGLAVSPSGARIFVPDAATGTVKVFEPASSLSAPVSAIDPGFASLVDAAVAFDPTSEHLLVVDNLQPGYEHPASAVDEFSATGAFLGPLPGAPVGGGPSGIAVDPGSGRLYVTSGNDEGSNVFLYGPYSASAATDLLAAPSGPASLSSAASAAEPAPAPAARRAGRQPSAASASDVLQRGHVRVKVDSDLAPKALPRHGAAGVHVSLETEIAATDGGTPPQLRRIAIAINRNGHFEPRGLPICHLAEIQPSSNAGALAACRASLVGEGSFSADVKLPEQSPFPSVGRVLAFNGRLNGHPAILAHVFGTKPVPTSFTLPFEIRPARGTYGTVLSASVPRSTGGFITGLRLNLGRSFRAGGERRSYISAGCPAPAGLRGAVFPLARSSFTFTDGPKLSMVITRNCNVR